MSTTLSIGTTSNTAWNVTPDTSGQLVIQTGSTPTTALTISASQVVTFANPPSATGGGNVSTNTAYGTSALATNSTGSYATAIGNNAGNGFTTGSGLTAIGVNAAKNTTGNDNVAIGLNALVTNTTGALNVAIGDYALNSNNANNNTAVGYQAGYAATGGGSTFVGNAAGYNLTTGSNGIFLGNSCSASSTNTVFEIVIGAGTTGKGSNTAFLNANSGYVYNGANTSSWSTTSDQRIKENIVTLTGGLATITKLRPVTFDYIVTKQKDVSFIAQEYQQVLPDQVNTHAASPDEAKVAGTDTLFGLNKNLDPYLVLAIQELNTLVTTQATTITQMQALLKAANVQGF